jgi:inhibitor of cysteine peptidase
MKQTKWTFVTVLLLAAVLVAACGPTATPAKPEPTGAEALRGEAIVEEIDILILESFPVQVNVVARGHLPDGCTKIDEVREMRTEQAFQITITTVRPADVFCTQATVPFEEVIALDVLGLDAGIYTVNVNGATGSFELSVDNEMPGEPTPA